LRAIASVALCDFSVFDDAFFGFSFSFSFAGEVVP